MEKSEELAQSLDSLSFCDVLLDRMSASCCYVERTVLFEKALGFLRSAIHEFEFGTMNVDTIPVCIKNITGCEEEVRGISETCCIDFRKEVYSRILGRFTVVKNVLHTELHRLESG